MRTRIAILACLLLAAIAGCDGNDGIGAFKPKNAVGEGGAGGPQGPTPQDGITELKALFAGAQIVAGPPRVGTLAPATGASGVSLATPIVIVFSESIDPASANPVTFRLLKPTGSGGGGGGIFGDLLPGGDAPNGDPVPSTVFADEELENRVVVLLPNDPLEPGVRYVLAIGPQATDLEGNGLEIQGMGGEGGGGLGGEGDGGGGPGGLFPIPGGGGPTIGGGKTFTSDFTTVAAGQPSPFGVVAMFPAPGTRNNAQELPILLAFSKPVLKNGPHGITGGNNLQVTIGGVAVKGSIEVLDDARLVRFAPKDPLPLGASVLVRVLGGVTDTQGDAIGNGPFSFAFEGRFRVTKVPAPTVITFPGSAPLTIGEFEFAATMTLDNVDAFATDVAFDGSVPRPDEVTLLFFQAVVQPGMAQAPPKGIGRLFTKKAQTGVTSFAPDLTAGGGEDAFVDSGSVDPPAAVLVGAFATIDGDNSPVGPLVEVEPFGLPGVFKKTTEPTLVLGPPGSGGDLEEKDAKAAPLDFRSVLRQPAIYGTSSEPLRFLRAVVDVTTIPSSLEAVPLASPSVTAANGFFVTEVWDEGVAGAAPRFLPTVIGELRVLDAVGNTFILRPPRTGKIFHEGSVGGALESGASDALRVRVVRSDDLVPLRLADVTVSAYPYDPLATPASITRSTAKNGTVSFGAGELNPFGPVLMITADRKGHDVFTLAGVRNPAIFGAPYGVSLPLDRSGAAPSRLEVTTSNLPTGLVSSFKAAAANGARPAGTAAIDDERFAVAAPLPGGPLLLDASPLRPAVVTAMAFDGAAGFFTLQDDVRVPQGDAAVAFDFGGSGGAPASARFAATTVAMAAVSGAGIADDPLDALRARLVGEIPGLPDVVPFSFAPAEPFDATHLGVRAAVPITLEADEPLDDPMVELLLQPEAGTGGGAPSRALLADAFRLEVEAADAGTTRFTRFRAQLDFALPGATVPIVEAVALPSIPSAALDPGVAPAHPPAIAIAGDDLMLPDGLVRVTLIAPNGRRWVALAAADQLLPATIPALQFAFPPGPSAPFKKAGAFDVVVETIEFAPGTFDADAFVFSDVEREHRRFARSATTAITTSP